QGATWSARRRLRCGPRCGFPGVGRGRVRERRDPQRGRGTGVRAGMRGDRLAGRVAVITGATSGIGAASARLFAAESAAVVIGGRNAERGEALAAELGERVMFVRCDVLVEEEIVGLIDTATAAFGRL